MPWVSRRGWEDEDSFIQYSSTSAIQGSMIATWILAFIAVAFRFVARRLSKAGLWYDDFMIIPALLCAFGLLFIGSVWLVNNGGLGHSSVFDPRQSMRDLWKGAYILEILWTVAITLVKFSILLLYFRLFEKSKIARWTIRALMGMVSLWGILILFLTVFQCNPVSSVWDWREPRPCIKGHTHRSIGSTIPHIITDAAILAIPIPVVWGLQMQLSQRLILCSIFSLGGFVTIISAVRLHYLIAVARPDPYTIFSDLANVDIWTGVEVNIAIVCACLPCLRPIASLIADKLRALRTRPRRGKELLIDMLPRRKQRRATPSTLPGSRNGELALAVTAPNPLPIELEAEERPTPEMNECCLQELNSHDVVAVELRAHTGRFSVMELEARELQV